MGSQEYYILVQEYTHENGTEGIHLSGGIDSEYS